MVSQFNSLATTPQKTSAWDFETETNHSILVRLPDLKLINKKKEIVKDFTVLTDHRIKIKSSKKVKKYQDLAREKKKRIRSGEREADGDSCSS